MTLAYSATRNMKFQGKFLGKRGNNSITTVPDFLVKGSEPGGDKKDHASEQCIHDHVLHACVMENITQENVRNNNAADQKGARTMIPAHSATYHFKCQEETKMKISKKITGKTKEQETLLNNNFSPPDNSTSIPACVTVVRGRTTQKQQLPRNRGREDHDQSSKFIYGDASLFKNTIKTPNEATIQRETQS